MSKKTKKAPAQVEAPERRKSVEDEAREPAAGNNASFLERMYGEQSKWLIPIVLAFGCVIIYYQTKGFDFINFDDPAYVYKNRYVSGGLTWENIKWAITAFHSANWHPLTWLSHQLDNSLFGLNAGNHHLVNALLHTVNSILLFFTIRKLTGSTWKSGVVAAIFAFHPAHVESVAWISERKDVLSTLFWLLTIWFYAGYGKGNKIRNYVLAFLCFAIGLTAKPMLVTLPFVLLLLDFWPLQRIEKLSFRNVLPLVVEKVPFFLLVVGSSIMTFLAQRSGGAVMALDFLPFSSRVINAVVSYVRYVLMLFYPVGLGGWYPYIETGFPLWQILLSALLLLTITAAALWWAYSRRYIFVGWFWYVGTLVPVIGLVQVGRQSHADRYTYLPYIGLSIMLVWLIGEVVEKYRVNKDVVAAVTIMAMIAFSILSFRQVSYWQNNETFYSRTLAVTERNFLFEQNYCQFLLEADRLDEAEYQCRNSTSHNPTYANGWLSLGLIQMKQKKYSDALDSFEVASRLRPADVPSFSNYINALIALERYDEAAEKTDLMAASDLPAEHVTPYLIPLYGQLSYIYAGKNEIEKAISTGRKAIALKPGDNDLRANLGLLLYKGGKPEEAIAEIKSILDQDPRQLDLQIALGKIYFDTNRMREAAAAFEKAREIDPDARGVNEYLEKIKGRK